MPTLCLRCTRSFLGVAWRSSCVAFLLVLPQFWLAWFLSSSSIAFSIGSVKVFSGRSGSSLPLFVVVPFVVRPLLESFLVVVCNAAPISLDQQQLIGGPSYRRLPSIYGNV